MKANIAKCRQLHRAMEPWNINSPSQRLQRTNHPRPKILERRSPTRLDGTDFATSRVGDRRSVRKLMGILLCLCLLQHPASITQGQPMPPAAQNQTNAGSGTNDSAKLEHSRPNLSLEIRCTTNIIKAGDEIPIQFIISNRGAVDYKYDDRNYDRGGRLWEYKLVAKTASGAIVPDARQHFRGRVGGLGQTRLLHPGESFSKVIALNLWALIKEPGQYEVTGTYEALLDAEPIISDPINITVLPRTETEMHDFIQELTNNIRPSGMSEDLVRKLMYTCSPEMVPILLQVMSAEGGNANFWAIAGLADYAPRTEATQEAILNAATKHGLNGSLGNVLQAYEFGNQEMKPVLTRALAADHPDEWQAGVWLALRYYDDALTTRLIAIANDVNARWDTRSVALRALTYHRTDAGVKAIKALLKEPAPDMLNALAETIENGYAHLDLVSTGRPLKPEDFSAEDLRPLIQQLLVSTNQALQLQLQGALLAKQFGSDPLTPQLVTLTTNSSPDIRYQAISALALNRTDEGVKTLKTLLTSPDPSLSKTAEAAIRNAYTARGDARGRPLRADDFDAKYREPEATPPK